MLRGDRIGNGKKMAGISISCRLLVEQHIIYASQPVLSVIANGNFFILLQSEIVLLIVDGAGPNSDELRAVQQQHYGVRGGNGHQRRVVVTASSVGRWHRHRISQHRGGILAAAPPLLTSHLALISLVYWD